MTLIRSTVSGNVSNYLDDFAFNEVGVIHNSGRVTLTNSTVSGNKGGAGAIITGGEMTLTSSTITGNQSSHPSNPGGIMNYGTLKLTNTIVAKNTNNYEFSAEWITANCFLWAPSTSNGHNLEDTNTCGLTGPGDQPNTDPRLGPLAENGGPTQTHALLAGSPAIDAGDDTACPRTDQRGVPRPVDGNADGRATCDIGAVEFGAVPLEPLAVLALQPTHGGAPGSVLAVVHGTGIADGAAVNLVRAGEPEIVGQPVEVLSARTVATAFDLIGKAPGAWDVVVSNPDGTTATLPGGFTIEEAREPELWVDFIGRSTIRDDQSAQFKMLVGNRGNVDAWGVPLIIGGIPKHIAVGLRFQIAAPPWHAQQIPTEWSQVPITVVSDEIGDYTVIPLVLPVVPAGFTGILDLTLTATDPVPSGGDKFDVQLVGVSPYFQPALDDPDGAKPDAAVVEAFAQGARNYAIRAFGAQVPIEKIPTIRGYLATQLKSIVRAGRQAWMESLGTKIQVYSLTQLLFDAAQFAVERDPEVTDFECRDHLGGTVIRIPGTSVGVCKPANPTTTYRFMYVPIRIVRSRDPNDKVGAVGAGQARYLSGEEPLRYAVFFENVETATAPAQEVVITDQLDLAKLDLSSFSLGSIAFGDKQVVPPPGLSEFTKDVDLRPGKNLIVRIEARLDRNTGLLTWRITSIDPDTGERPDDPLAGFLPPNSTPPEGEGSVFFTVKPKPGLATGAEIKNKATIVFDVNSPIHTPEWINTLDNTKPESRVLSLAASQSSPSFEVQWGGTDVGSGILDYFVFVSEDGGPFTVWLNTAGTSGLFTGQPGKTYTYFSVARDQTGNLEDPPIVADAFTQVLLDFTPPLISAAVSPSPNANGWNNSDVTVRWSVTDPDSGIVTSTGCENSTVTGETSATTLTCTATNGGGVFGSQSITVRIDKTAPSIVGTRTPGPNPNGWNTTDVTVSFACDDALSGVDSCGGQATVAAEGANQGVTREVTDRAGNRAYITISGINIDKTPPTISVSRNPAPNAEGWNNTNVMAHFEAHDTLSGIKGASYADMVFSQEGANQAVTYTFTDQAGNTASATVSDINIDKTAPVITGLPPAGCTLWPPNHKLVQVGTVSAADGLSGLAPGSLGVSGTSSEPANGLGDGDTAPDIVITGTTVQLRAERAGNGPGRLYTLTATARDLAGNRGAATATCTVPQSQTRP